MISKNIINGLEVHIYDKHNEVLSSWFSHFDKIGEPFSLITFDYHTDTKDTSEANYAVISEINTKNISGVEKGKEIGLVLQNDEHIKVARRFGIINSYHVITMSETYDDSRYNGYYYKNNECDCCGMDCDGRCDKTENNLLIRRISDSYLKDADFNMERITGRIVLDFDLDYFACNECFDIEITELTILKALINKAELITIACEQEYFDINKHDKSGTFNNQKALKRLKEIIEFLKTKKPTSNTSIT